MSKLRLIILGAPGSGKGTISKRILKCFNINYLSTGDLLRENIKNKTELGLKTKKIIENGKLVPDDLITNLIYNEINKLDKNSGWLIDGFPRTLNQAKYLDNKNLIIDQVINLNVPFDIILSRLEKRWVHIDSGRIYNLDFNPPKIPVSL